MGSPKLGHAVRGCFPTVDVVQRVDRVLEALLHAHAQGAHGRSRTRRSCACPHGSPHEIARARTSPVWPRKFASAPRPIAPPPPLRFTETSFPPLNAEGNPHSTPPVHGRMQLAGVWCMQMVRARKMVPVPQGRGVELRPGLVGNTADLECGAGQVTSLQVTIYRSRVTSQQFKCYKLQVTSYKS